MSRVTINDLFRKIGELTVENDLLRVENDHLRRALAAAESSQQDAGQKETEVDGTR